MSDEDKRKLLDRAVALMEGRAGDADGGKRPREAESLLSGHLLANPKDVSALNLLGIVKHQLGKFAEARELFGRALAAAPGMGEAHYNLGRVLQDLGLWDAAADSLRRALDIDPGNNNAVRALADVEKRLDERSAGAPAKVVVLSHERSGTHFLMNTIAENFGYSTRPWIDLDYPAAVNPYDAREVAGFFKRYRGRAEPGIIKSHHHYRFFAPMMEALLDEFRVFYVYRDPREVMASYWRFIAAVPWEEGPATPSPSAFMRARPVGGMTRYQWGAPETVLARWQAHVKSFLVQAPRRVRDGLHFIRYEDLAGDFEATVARIGAALEATAPEPRRPSATENVVVPGRAAERPDRSWLSAEDEALIVEAVDDDLKPFFQNQ